MNKQLSAIILLIIAMVIWGSAFAVTKASLAEVPPVLFALLRFVVASILLSGLVIWRVGLAELSRPLPWETIELMGLTGVCFYYISYNISLVYTTASQGALIQSFIPAITALLAAFFLKESLTAVRLLGIAVSIGGIFFIITFSKQSAEATNTTLGNLIMLGAVLIWCFYTILAKRLAYLDPLIVTAGATVTGTVMLFPAALLELGGKPFPVISASGWASIVYLGAFSSAAAMLLYNRSLQHLSASQTANFLNLMPVVAVLTAVGFLGETITVWQMAGGALVLVGVWISLQKRRGERGVKQ